MEWLFALGAVALLVWLAVKFRGFRLGILGLLMLIVAGGGVWYLYHQMEEQRLRTLISPQQLEFRDFTMETAGYTRAVTGTLKNNSPLYTLRTVTLAYRVQDCPRDEQAPRSQCETVGQETRTAYVSVPPGQIREFRSSVSFPNMPPIKGRIVWNFDVVEVVAAN